jgi:phosphatidylserine/phosphatidylglycerophosphate/cardiolipin synthase-like enzyme
MRARAFALAREQLTPERVASGEAETLLQWLEGVIKLMLPDTGAPGVQALADACFSPDDDCPGRIRRLFSEARRSADVCVFTITDDRLTRAILDAHSSGVKVRIITDDQKSQDPGSDIEQLARAGVDVRADSSSFHMHHKFAIFDGALLLTGSYNWTRGAARDNQENLVITPDSRLVTRFAAAFDRLWERFAP